jgi:hypothetical protein
MCCYSAVLCVPLRSASSAVQINASSASIISAGDTLIPSSQHANKERMMDTTRIERDLRLLKGYAVIMTLLVGVLALGAFARPGARQVGEIQGTRAKFDVIDVERINVMEPDGKYRLVISNRPRSIGPIYKGKPFGYEGGGRPGLIWFNDEGTENGGLTFTGIRGADGRYRASTHMSFDQFNQDQVLNLDYADNNGQRLTGFSINDRADIDIYDMWKESDSIGKMSDTVARNAALAHFMLPRNGVPLNAQRMFFGKDRAKNAAVNLSDPLGRPRLRLVVDSLGAARIEFLDAAGKVTNSMNGTGSR